MVREWRKERTMPMRNVTFRSTDDVNDTLKRLSMSTGKSRGVIIRDSVDVFDAILSGDQAHADAVIAAIRYYYRGVKHYASS